MVEKTNIFHLFTSNQFEVNKRKVNLKKKIFKLHLSADLLFDSAIIFSIYFNAEMEWMIMNKKKKKKSR